MNARRLIKLLIVTLFVAALPGLMVALAQDDAPVKGDAPAAGFTREEALQGDVQAGLAAGREEREPNNDLGTANYLYTYYGDKVSGEIGVVGDVDYYALAYLEEGWKIAAAVSADWIGSGLDSVLRLYDGSGNQVASNDDSHGLDSYLEYTVSGGTYYLRVEDFANAHGGPDHWYDLYVWVVDPGCEEPNNSQNKAAGVAYTGIWECAHIDRDGDVDWYRFEGKKGDLAEVYVETTGVHGTVETVATLYNGSKALDQCGPNDWGVNDTNCFLSAVLPKTGTYHVKVTDAHNKGGPDKRYWLEVTFDDPYEPNEDASHSQYIGYGQIVRSRITPGDRDWYRFYGAEGDRVTLFGTRYMNLYDSDGTTLLHQNYEDVNAVSVWLPHDGVYYVEVYIDFWEDFYVGAGLYELAVGPVMLLGLSSNGKIGDLQYQKGDILAYFPDSDSYIMYFDGSDVGVKGNLADFEVISYGMDGSEDILYHDSILMTFSGAVNLPGLGQIKAQDIVRFDPYNLGSRTDGDWRMYLHGSDIGLTTGAETIDALDVWYPASDEVAVFSTTGTATYMGFPWLPTSNDEDLVSCYLDQEGWDTNAACGLWLDGSDLPANADVASASGYFVTFSSPVKIGGVTNQRNDIARFECSDWQPFTDCVWQPQVWVGNNHGLKGKAIDGLAYP